VEPVFFERQQFRQTWLWVLLLVVCLPTIIGAGAVLFDLPPGAAAPRVVIIGAEIILIVTLLITWSARLDVTVDDRELLVRFWPFHRQPRRFPLSEIAEAQVRRYQPIVEYGGWGIRFGFHGMAYNVSGNEGVQLVLTNGKRILIGSQKSEELQRALRRA
jgi:hypothetical protein